LKIIIRYKKKVKNVRFETRIVCFNFTLTAINFWFKILNIKFFFFAFCIEILKLQTKVHKIYEKYVVLFVFDFIIYYFVVICILKDCFMLLYVIDNLMFYLNLL